MDSASFELATPENAVEETSGAIIAELELSDPGLLIPTPPFKLSKDAVRTSLQASTWDGVFATIFSNITGGVLLTGFLMELGATPSQIGILASIPMLANLVQPIGAYWSEQTDSRRNFCFWIYGISRSLWLVLAIAILCFGWQSPDRPLLILLTLGIALISSVLGALGSAPWLSWMAVLVPRQLRGRYFSIRNSAANLTNLISLPLLGLIVSKGFDGSLLGYAVVLVAGIGAGLISLGFQRFQADVNPQGQQLTALSQTSTDSAAKVWQNPNALLFLLYLSGWMFAFSLSASFYNLYMLDKLTLDISQVTLYNSLIAVANLLLLTRWGKLADRAGNIAILLPVSVVVAAIPLLWLVPGTNLISIWFWLPLLHILIGGAGAAIDLCSNNLQIDIAPPQSQSTYFGLVAAVSGVTSALGTTAGGFLAQFWHYEGVLGLFVLSSLLRFAALLPLLFMNERNSQRQTQFQPIQFQRKKVEGE